MNVNILERRNYLLQLAHAVIREHDIWSHAPDVPGISPRCPLHGAFNDLFEGFSIGDMPFDCRDLDALVRQLAPQWDAYVNKCEAIGEYTGPPPAGFWTLFGQLPQALSVAEVIDYPPLEPPWELERQGLSSQQIARIYDWYTAAGDPDTGRVQLAKTRDREKFAAGVSNPLNEKRRNERARVEAKMREALDTQQRRAETMKEPAPESIEQLIEEKVGPAQIARMKLMTLSELEQYASKNGLTLPAEPTVDRPPATNLPPDRTMEDWDSDTIDQGELDISELTIEERVVLAATENPEMTPGQIGELFDIGHQKVTAILKRANEMVSG